MVKSGNTTDPDLGGPLAWVVNDGWERVNTAISILEGNSAMLRWLISPDSTSADTGETFTIPIDTIRPPVLSSAPELTAGGFWREW